MWDASDEALLAGYTTGDPDAATAFIRRFEHRVFGLALLLMRDRAVADEVAQDAMVRAWRYGDSYDPRRGSVLGWLLTIVRNVAFDHRRIDARRLEDAVPDLPPDLLFDDADIAGAAAQRDDAAQVLAAMRSLPDEQRDAVAAVTLYGLTGREYSKAAGLPLGTVKTRVRLGLRKLPRPTGGPRTMTDDCQRVTAVADELALGMLAGRDRAEALAHLESCQACRSEIATIGEVADAVLLLAPGAAPDPGFEQRVLDRLGYAAGRDPAGIDRAATAVSRRPRGRRLRSVLAVAALVATIVAASLVWETQRAPQAVAATMLDTQGDVVGRVSLMADDGTADHGTAVVLDLPGWDTLIRRYGDLSTGYQVELSLDDGSRVHVRLPPRHASTWRVGASVDRSRIIAVAIVDRYGHQWCHAALS